ncbi:MAG: helix-turn-helix domain-containing protein [Myxococcales bacterium]|nr:helix-turn-helix domain-containing protein [Myxococcales bacterium]MCB9579898.1 helix-turn-helix domain-containing protein [Polyangiaceae bacterium]
MAERDTLPPTSDRLATPPRHVRHVIAVGGGRGGVGKSVLTVNLGVYLAQLGRTVVVVDADPAGAELHTMLGIDLPEYKPTGEDGEEDLTPLPTPVPGLMLLPQLYSVGSTVPIRPGRKPRWARRLRQLDVDWVVLDLGAGTAPATLDLFLGADLGICVTAPEPPSVESTFRFIRAVFQRRIRRTLVKDRFKMRLVERAQSELPPLPAPQDLARAIGRYDVAAGELALQELARLSPLLVVNGVRLRTDSDLGPAMCDMAARYLGVGFEYVGHVEQDDSVWLGVVRRRPLLIDSPTSKSARNIERIARRILALATTREHGKLPDPISLVSSDPNLYDVLGTHRGATDEEVRRAYKRQRDLYQTGSLALTSLLTEEALRTEQARVEEAHETLLDPIRRRAYDISVFPDDGEDKPKRSEQTDAALEAERAMLRQELTREINAETEFTGRLLGKVRESQGIEIEEIAEHTKISSAHLRAIEAEDFKNLPALVYTRGFVQQVAKYLKLDQAQVSRTYLRRMRQWRADTGEA